MFKAIADGFEYCFTEQHTLGDYCESRKIRCISLWLFIPGRLDMIVVNRYGSSASRGEDVLGKLDTFLVGKAGLPELAAKSLPFHSLDGIPLVLPAVPNGLRATLDVLSRRHDTRLIVCK